MHGGARGSGAPKGNQNAMKHGCFTKEALRQRARITKVIREAKKLLKEFA